MWDMESEVGWVAKRLGVWEESPEREDRVQAILDLGDEGYKALLAIEDDDRRAGAIRGVVTGWKQAHPWKVPDLTYPPLGPWHSTGRMCGSCTRRFWGPPEQVYCSRECVDGACMEYWRKPWNPHRDGKPLSEREQAEMCGEAVASRVMDDPRDIEVSSKRCECGARILNPTHRFCSKCWAQGKR